MVVGITSDFVPGADIARLDAEVSIDGEEATRVTWSVGGADPLAFPIELPLDDSPDGARVDVLLSGFEVAGSEAPPFVTRRAATSAAVGKDMLLRTHLEWECVPSFNLGGESLAPTCTEPDTCVAAECVDPYVPPENLEPYSPTWASPSPTSAVRSTRARRSWWWARASTRSRPSCRTPRSRWSWARKAVITSGSPCG